MNIAKLSFDYTDRKHYLFGLVSDIHADSPGHDKKRFTNDMNTIASEDGRILVNGDLFDGIMPTDRKRYSRSGDIMRQDAQLNERIDFMVNYLKPYADYIDYIGFGNHECSIVKYNNCDPIALLVREMNKIRNPLLPQIQRGGYVGFIMLHFHRNGESVKRQLIYRDHGKGGNAPVTKGIIALNRLYGTYDSDIYWIGHSHTSVIDPVSQWTIGVTSNGKIYRKNKIGIITPGYNRNFDEEEYGDNDYYRSNFAEERFSAPTGIGYGRLEIDVTSDDIRSKVSIV